MRFVKLSGHEQTWNYFCFENTWFWHTTHWLDYLKNSKFGVEFIDHSFFCEQNGEIVDVVPLIQEGDQFASPGFADKKEILAEVRRIALENGIKRIQVNSDIKSYLNISGYTCILDLHNVMPTKGHRSAIKKAERYLTYRESIDIDRFKADYFRVAGKATRPDYTFYLLGGWLSIGFGTLLEALYDRETVGYTYLLHWKDRAYYFMSCVFPEFKQYNVSHYLQAQAFKILRQKGIRWYELGGQIYNSLICQPSEKERNISKFKRGFGGEIVVKPVSEYFFDSSYMVRTYAGRLKNYVEREYENNPVLSAP